MIERAELPVQRNRTLYCVGIVVLLRSHLRAASRAASCFFGSVRLHSADEGAQELSIHLRGQHGDINSLPGEEFARVFCAVNPRWFDVDLFESASGELIAVVVFF